MASKKIMLVNAGSSSIKFQLLNYDDSKVIARGLCEAIGLDISKYSIEYNNNKISKEIKFKDFKEAMNHVLKSFYEYELIKDQSEIIGIGHRVVHDGSKTKGWTVINDEVLKIIEDNIKFAPLHNKFQLEAIKIIIDLYPGVLQIACFDTGFHNTIPEERFMYAIKKEWYEKYNIRRFGFHGLSYDYINSKMQTILNKQKNNLIVCHLGSGSSMCFIKDSKSYNTSMGFSTYDGLVMCTRPGDLSPGVMNFLSNELKLSADEVANKFLKECGLKGLTGYSDLRYVVEDLNNKDNKLAFDLFVNRVVDYICMGINQLDNKVDAIVFTAGIGQNSSLVRKAVIDKIKIKKIKLDEQKNNSKCDDYLLISEPESELAIYVVNTDEESVIAKYLKQALASK